MNHGVPLNIVRGVTTYKYGPGATAAQFDYEASQLATWYKQLYPRYGGSALVNWVRAAAAEMGPGVSTLDVQKATSYQSVSITGLLTAPFWATVATLIPGAASVGAATIGESGFGDLGAGATDSTGVQAGGSGETGAGTGAGDAAAGDAAAGGAAGAGLTAAEKAALKELGGAGVAVAIWEWLTTASHWVRVLEYVGGAVLIYLGIKGLADVDTGPTNIVEAAAKVAK
ncbi:MAG: hypothetical protein ACTHMY_01645 [Solirubrobacteraceae bacterium]